MAMAGLLLVPITRPLWAAENAPATVVLKVPYLVENGRLTLDATTGLDPTAEAALLRLYDGDEKLTGIYRSRVLAEIKSSLERLNPLADWRLPMSEQPVRSILPAPRVAEALSFSGGLGDWLGRFAGPDIGTFLQWTPTRPTRPEEEGEEKPPEDPFDVLMTQSAASLIGKIPQDLMQSPNRTNAVLRIRFGKPVPVTNLTVMGIQLAPADRLPPGWRSKHRSAEQEQKRLEQELQAAAGYIGLAWNDDLAVQRMMSVFRARGMWNKFAQTPAGQFRTVHWLTFNPTNSQPQVHLPHLCHIIFEPGADQDKVVRDVARVLLDPEECRILAEALPLYGQPRTRNDRLKNVIKPRSADLGGGRYIDLFALQSYVLSHTNTVAVALARPLPVKQAWLEPRLTRIEDLGWKVSDDPTMKDDNRLQNSRGRKRKSFERGGIDITVSPPRAAKQPATGAAGTNAPPNETKAWFQRLKYRAEIGVSAQDTQPIAWLARMSAADSESLGQFAVELRYQYRFSGSLDWKPSDSENKLLPSTISAFTESSARRKVDGKDVELQRDGLRLQKGKVFDQLDGSKRYDVALQVARVRETQAPGSPTENEFTAPLGVSITSEPNLWDGREYYQARIRATPSVRGRSDADFWTLAEAAGQLRIPWGSGDYFASLDVRTSLGSTPTDALPYVGGVEGVRGVRPFGAPARTRIVLRNELWTQAPFISRDTGSDQLWFGRAYEMLRLAAFVDAAWAESLREGASTRPWFVSPGVGLRLLLGSAHLSLDYAYGFTRPASLGGNRISLGITTHF